MRLKPAETSRKARPETYRRGKVVALMLITLPTVAALLALSLDGGMLTGDVRATQHSCDLAACSAAMELALGKGTVAATATAIALVQQEQGMSDALVTVQSPPTSGHYAAETGFVEVTLNRQFAPNLRIPGLPSSVDYQTRAVAGRKPSTAGCVVVALDTSPSALTVSPVPVEFPASPALVGGLEVLGAGSVSIDGAVVVNAMWGGVDEDGEPAGESPGPPYGISCTPVLPLTKLSARDIRVSGGVDDPSNYGAYESGESSPLDTNRLPIADPLLDLPVPASGISGVDPTLRGSINLVNTLLPTTLEPGVYEYIRVAGSQVTFQPGVYIVRNVHPLTNIAVQISAATVLADGVMFYVTNSPSYDAFSGAPDDADDIDSPPTPGSTTLTPSVSIGALLPGSRITPIADATSPYHQMTVMQRRIDRRPIALVANDIVGGASIEGSLYAKWGHLSILGQGELDLKIASGTIRLISLLGMELIPTESFPPVEDVFLVE